VEYKLEYVTCTVVCTVVCAVVCAVCLLCEQYGGQVTVIVYVNMILCS
jgi:hypothetical protein